MTDPAPNELIEGDAVDVLVIGAGPAGLMAAEEAASRGARVLVVDQMPSVGRKLLMAGKSGLNLTHAEPCNQFLSRYGADTGRLKPILDVFGPEALRAWAKDLGQEMFAGSSGRVLPKAMKASPLLRAWLARLVELGVRIETRTRLKAIEPGRAQVVGPQGARWLKARATVLALGGASWPRLGSDGKWPDLLTRLGLEMAPFRASNVGWRCAWSPFFVEKFAGAPIKAIRVWPTGTPERTSRGELTATEHGLEGGGLYPLAPALLAMDKPSLTFDLAPDRSEAALTEALTRLGEKKQSLANRLRRAARITGVKAALLREAGATPAEPRALAKRIKALEIPLLGPRPIEEAISTTGGVRWDDLDEQLMIAGAPGIFVAGEMVDWDAPTGGYLLTACFAMGRWVGAAASQWALRQEKRPPNVD